MSTILKALRQLEKDQPPDPVDAFGDVVEPDPTATPARAARRARGGSAGTLLGIALAGAGLLLIGLALQPMFRTATPVLASSTQSVAPEVEHEVAATPDLVRPPAVVATRSQPPSSEQDAPVEDAEAEMDFAVWMTGDTASDEALPVVAPSAPVLAAVEPTVELAAEGAPVRAAARANPLTPKTRPGQGGAVAFVPAVVAVPAEAAPVPKPAPQAPEAGVVAAAAAPKPEVVAAAPIVAAVSTRAEPAPTNKPPARPVAQAAPKAPPQPRAVAPEVAPKAPERPVEAEVALDADTPEFEEIRRPLDPPALFPVQTSWHPKRERREARLEAHSGQTQVVREGDDVDGYKVLEISPSAVVFERGGETVRVGVGGR